MHESADPTRDQIPGNPAALFAARARAGDDLRGLATGFFVLVAATCGLIILGALVRAHDAGLACPDWPLCFGDVIPRMNLEVAFEWTHRLIAGSVSIVFLTLALKTLRRANAPRSVRVLLPLAMGLLAIQVVLGALTVWLKLASWTVTAHLVTGNGFALTLLLVGCALRDAGRTRPPRAAAPPAARALLRTAAGLLLLQMLLGGLVSSRYAALACPEWPTCNGGQWIPAWSGGVGLHVLHRFNAYALLTTLAAAAAASRSDPGLRRLTALALGLGLAEAAAGVANVWFGVPAEITGLHTGLAAALVLTLTLTLREIITRTPARA